MLPGVRCWSAANPRRIRGGNCARRAAVLPGPCSTLAVAATGRRHGERRQRRLWHHRERSGELTLGTALHHDDARALGDHHAGGRPLRRVLVPTAHRGAGGGDRRPPRPCHQAPDAPRQAYHAAPRLAAFRLLPEPTRDPHGIGAKPVVLLWPLVVVVHGEDIPRALAQVARGGPLGAQPAAPRLFCHAGQALCRGSDCGLQPLPHRVHRARRGEARPAPALAGPCCDGDGQQLGRGRPRTALGRRGFGRGAAAIRRLVCGTRGRLERTLGRLARACQPLLPPVVRRAGGPHHRPIGRPVERDLACLGVLGGGRTVRRRLRGGEDAKRGPRVGRHRLGEAPPACVIDGG